MKKKLLYIISVVLTLTFVLVSCSKPPTETASEYFPYKANAMYMYLGDPDEKFNQATYAGYIEGNMMQRVYHQSATLTTEVFKYDKGELRLTYANPEIYEFRNVMHEPSNIDYLILKEPLKKGTKWSMSGDDSTEITSMDADIETPYGSFTAMEVTTTYSNGDKIISYYAKDIGLVKQISKYGGLENSYALIDISESAKSSIGLSIFWFDANDNYAIQKERIVFDFGTNDDIMELLTSTLKAEGENYKPLITPNTKLNSVTIDNKNSLLTLDVSAEFLSEMELSRKDEEATLQCIANTIGNLYKKEKFVITVDGKGYKSDNISFADNEYLLVAGQQPEDSWEYQIQNYGS